jgi:hypothetical protein
MAEYRVPTQQELDRLLYMQGMQGKSNQQIIDENLARGSTIQSLPDNFFQTASAGARRVGDYVNQAGNAQQIVNKLFPSNIGNSQYQIPIPTSFNFAPKQAPTGEILPAGLQTQSVPVASILQAIKPADVLGISGAGRAYGDIGAGKAPQPLDVVDTLGLGAGLTAAGRLAAKGGMATGRYIAPELGNMAEQYAAKTGLLQSVKPIDAVQPQAGTGLLQTAPRSEIGFYSAVEQAAMASPRKSATGQAFLNDIMKGQDVRADEIKWMGLDDYLKGKQNVTKQEVQDYIANNRVDVKEVQLGDTKFNKLSDEELINEYIRIRGYDPVSNGEALTRNDILYELEGMNRTESGSTKFSQYTLPGGENYRELILTMPSKKLTEAEARIVLGAAPDAKLSEASIAYASRKNVDEYKSSHFPEQENPLAHIRVNDRIDSEGKKMLLIEEVQSDWHQAGREQGYETKELKNALEEYDRLSRKYANNGKLPPDELARIKELQPIVSGKAGGVPDAPFKDTWYQLALKRAIQHAAENGYDRIGLTTGKQQADRFDLSKQVDRIDVESVAEVPNLQFIDIDVVDGERIALEVENGLVRQGEFAGKRLSDIVGKEMADKISKVAQGDTSRITGNDLRIGGEGMKKYYDEIYPKFLDKYGKKWGTKIKEVSLGGESMGRGAIENRLEIGEGFRTTDGKWWGDDYDGAMEHEANLVGSPIVRYLDITPEMKAGVSKGQPLFAAVPAIPAAGLLAPQEKRR